jgi:hypothetical protein
MEEQDEQARAVPRRLMAHHFPGQEMSIRSGADDAAVRVELPLQDDDRVRGSVLVRAAHEPSWVADQVVLLPPPGSSYSSRKPIGWS